MHNGENISGILIVDRVLHKYALVRNLGESI